MSRFRPARASPPLRPPTIPVDVNPNDLNDSRSSSAVIPELMGLSPEEVDFIDAVIERAPATATTFLTVFKAYNDILQERGLDPQNEVIYYGKLLKLGTLKGKNWGEKWNIIKQQQGYISGTSSGSGRTTRVKRATPAYTSVNTRLTTGFAKTQPEETLTLHSYPDDAESVQTEENRDSHAHFPPYHDTPPLLRRAMSPSITTNSNTLGLHTGPPSSNYNPRSTPRAFLSRRVIPMTPALWNDRDSEATADTTDSPSTIPPSYGAAVRDTAHYRNSHLATPRPQSKIASSRALSSSPPPTLPASRVHERERRNSVINEEDAWTKIKEAQDEKEADRFREDRLLERCWEVWKQGYQWIITTHEQIAQARDTLIVRLALHRWRQRTAALQDLYMRVVALSNGRRLKLALQLWKVKLKEKRQADWRNSMRARMKMVRDHREAKVLKDAWAKWRQSYRSHLSEQHYSERLVLRYFKRWKGQLTQLDQLDAAAEHFVYAQDERYAERCWDLWRRAIERRNAERMMATRVGLRLLGGAMDIWKKRLHDNRLADELYDIIVLKRAMGAWKAARDRIRAIESRASKHLARQDDVLVRAVLRVWKAHERGRLLERVSTARLLKQAWAAWKRRMQHQQDLEDLALAFAMRSSSISVSSSVQKWRQVHSTHQNALSFAVHYHSAQLRYKMLLTWRLRLRSNLGMVKQAKLAQKFFLQRRCWKKWMSQLAQKRLERKLQDFEVKITRKYFLEWLHFTQQQRQRKVAEEIVRQRIAMRVMTNSLMHWVNRVVDIKDRELVVNHRYRLKLLTFAFKKWKALCVRHVEELSLMESYQDVKREENMRKMFYRWLAAARTARHRRLQLQQKEEEMKLTLVAAAWDKWRERFQDIRLQPMADGLLIQKQKNIMFRAFGIWHSKTRSLPAVRFHASHTKLKAWKIWRDAMPRALQARRARETDRRLVLSKVFDKWHGAYKTKIELKAVARARYLRLPTAAPRQSIEHPRPIAAPQASQSSFPPRPVRPISPSNPIVETRPSPSNTRPFSAKSGISTWLSGRSMSPERPGRRSAESRAPTSISRPKLSTRGSTTRATSPTHSQFSIGQETRDGDNPRAGSTASAGNIGRSSLWQELRGIQLRSRPLSDRARSREPP